MSIDDKLTAILKKLEMLDEDSMTSFGDGLTSDFMAPATSSTQVVDTMITSQTTAPSTQPFPLAAFAMEQEVAVQQKMVLSIMMTRPAVAPSPRAKMAADLWKKQETQQI
uniref:Uncharacterized protein n=1 Tax=Oryza glaberrima TaxID=4538 RepID=A0A1V1H6Y7_ORYGL|nr:hypothetical protein [Oryza glaberrima]